MKEEDVSHRRVRGVKNEGGCRIEEFERIGRGGRLSSETSYVDLVQKNGNMCSRNEALRHQSIML